MCLRDFFSTLLEEMKTGLHLARETLLPICERHQTLLKCWHVGNKAGFISVMREIHRCCAETINPKYPIIHIEVHGLSDCSGLLIQPSGEAVTWQQFSALCRAINLTCKNNLVCVMAVCLGYHSVRNAEIAALTPFCTLIGPHEEVKVGDVENWFPGFYESLLNDGDIVTAMGKLGGTFRRYDCQEMFTKAYIHYVKTYCRGKGKQERLESVLTMARPILLNMPLGPLRRIIKRRLIPTEQHFDYLKARFLMSDHPENAGRFAVNFHDVMDILNQTPTEEQSGG